MTTYLTETTSTYYFDTIIDGKAERDENGTVLCDAAAARREALATLCGLAQDTDFAADGTEVVVTVFDQHHKRLIWASIFCRPS